MEIATIHGETRKPGGRHANERVRRRGMVPAVIYGHAEPPECVAISQHDLVLALEHLTHVIQLDVNGETTQYLLKDVQYDHLQKDPIHVDLMRVDATERVTVKVGIDFKGEPKGIHDGGEFVHVLTDLELECPLLEIPEMVVHNVKDLALDETLCIKDLTLPPGAKALHEPDEIVALVRPKRGVQLSAEEEAAAEEAAAAEPEVIGKGPKEEGAGDAGA